jgi:N utilization substance protein A
VYSNDEHVDPVGSCVGQKGIRVTTVMSELGAEKIDIIPWSEDGAEYVSNALSPARVLDIQIDEAEHKALVQVADEQLSLAIGKGGQNVRLAAKLTGWKIDIKGLKSDEITSSDADEEKATEIETVEEEVATPEEN